MIIEIDKFKFYIEVISIINDIPNIRVHRMEFTWAWIGAGYLTNREIEEGRVIHYPTYSNFAMARSYQEMNNFGKEYKQALEKYKKLIALQ